MAIRLRSGFSPAAALPGDEGGEGGEGASLAARVMMSVAARSPVQCAAQIRYPHPLIFR
jgi:hypothetical protein